MSFNREKYAKPVALKTIKEGVDEAQANSPSAKGGSGNFAKTVYHQLEEGDNWFKIAPAHDPEKSAYVPKCTVKLEAEGDVWKDGERTEEKEVKSRNIFVATVHSPKDKNGKLIVSKDPVETYIAHLTKIINEQYQDKDERKAKLLPVGGFRDKKIKNKDGKFIWHFGIRPDHKLATWAWNKQWQIGQLELSNKQRKQMDQLCIAESAEDTIAVDIFSSLEEGFPVILTKTTTGEGNNKKTEYTTRCETLKNRQSWDDFWAANTPPDAACEEWASKKSLDEMFVGVYSKRDFEMVVDGLERFDAKWNYGVFEDQEFLDEMEEISEMVDKLPAKEEKESKKEVKEEKKASITSKIKKQIEEEEATPMAMKKFLRKYIVDNYDDELSLPDLTPKDLKKWYELAKNDEELPFDLEEKEEVEEEEEEQEEEKPVVKAKSTSKVDEEIDDEEVESSIAALRARRKK